MKKTYIAPEMEIKKFSVEDIMTNSSATPAAFTTTDVSKDEYLTSIDYNTVFNIQGQ